MLKKLICIVLSLLFFCGCSNAAEEETETMTITNKADVMAVKADLSKYQWVNVENEDIFLETSMREMIKFFTEKGSGIIYMGYVGCPWCERALPVLYDAADEEGISVYYVDVYNTEVNSLDDYHALEPYIQEIFELDEDRKPVFKVPEVIAVKDGKIVGHHLALVEGYKIIGAESQMNDEQKQTLKEIYLDLFEAAAD